MATRKNETPKTERDHECGWKAHGVYRKYLVKRLKDREGKHRRCEFFVLDLDHDEFAGPALRAYATACAEKFPQLAADLEKRLSRGYDGSHLVTPSPFRERIPR